MRDRGGSIAVAETSGATQCLVHYEGDSRASSGAEVSSSIAIVESRTFLRECIRRSMQAAFSVPIATYSTMSELKRRLDDLAGLVLLSLMEASPEAGANALKALPELTSRVTVVVLASKTDAELAKSALRCGAKGYIPVTMGFEIAVEAVRFVMAGGTYAPMDCLLATSHPLIPAARTPRPAGVLTGRELSVVRAIQQGKSNKIIAYELNMCESTVKVHVRNLMRKLEARNRTDAAIKAGRLAAPGGDPLRIG